MPSRTIDLVAAGPPPSDLYDPAAPAWALAAGLAARGHSVQVTFPGPKETASPAPGVAVAPFPAVTAHVGTFVGDAELGRQAAHRIRPNAEVILRDPSGLGPIGFRRGHRPLVSFVRAFAVDTAFDRSGAVPAGVADRLFSWRDRRSVRRLERAALQEATAICCTSTVQRDRLRSEYRIPAERLRVSPPAVAHGPAPPSRAAARRRLSVPDDVPLAILLPPAEPATPAAAAPAIEAFQRTRPIFPGARLAVVGFGEAAGPGVVAVPARDLETVASAVAAADVAVAYAPPSGVDPGIILALRAGVATVVPPTFDLGDGSETAARRATSADAGDLASVLAELFADPEGRRLLGEAGRAFASRFDPERLADELESAGALAAP